MLKRALIYGALIAIAGAALTFIIDAAGLADDPQASQAVSWIGFLFPIVGIVLAIRGAKRADPGPFSFGDGFKQGALVSLVAGVLSAVLTYVYFTAINPDMIDTMRQAMNTQLSRQGLQGRELEQMRSMQEGMLTPTALTTISFLTQLITGLIVSAIAAAILRRKETSSADGFGGDGYGTPA